MQIKEKSRKVDAVVARRNEYKKAKTCKHAIQLTEFGGLFVKNTCVNEHKLMLPCPNQMGIAVKRPYVMAIIAVDVNHMKTEERQKKTEKDRKRKVR